MPYGLFLKSKIFSATQRVYGANNSDKEGISREAPGFLRPLPAGTPYTLGGRPLISYGKASVSRFQTRNGRWRNAGEDSGIRSDDSQDSESCHRARWVSKKQIPPSWPLAGSCNSVSGHPSIGVPFLFYWTVWNLSKICDVRRLMIISDGLQPGEASDLKSMGELDIPLAIVSCG